MRELVMHEIELVSGGGDDQESSVVAPPSRLPRWADWNQDGDMFDELRDINAVGAVFSVSTAAILGFAPEPVATKGGALVALGAAGILATSSEVYRILDERAGQSGEQVMQTQTDGEPPQHWLIWVSKYAAIAGLLSCLALLLLGIDRLSITLPIEMRAALALAPMGVLAVFWAMLLRRRTGAGRYLWEGDGVKDAMPYAVALVAVVLSDA